MSAYYKIKDYTVRVSDHEPNFGAPRHLPEIEIYTHDVCKEKLAILPQVEKACEKFNLDIQDFCKILEDWEIEELPAMSPEKLQLHKDFDAEMKKAKEIIFLANKKVEKEYTRPENYEELSKAQKTNLRHKISKKKNKAAAAALTAAGYSSTKYPFGIKYPHEREVV